MAQWLKIPAMKDAGPAIAGAGLAMVLAAALVTAVKHVQTEKTPPCPRTAPAGQAAPATPPAGQDAGPAKPRIVDVQTFVDNHGPVIQLGRPICVTVAGLADEPAQRTADVETAKTELKQAETDLLQARRDLAAAGETAAHSQAQQKVTDLTALRDDRKTRLTAAQSELNAGKANVEMALFVDGRKAPAGTVTFRGEPGEQSREFVVPRVPDASSEDAAGVRKLLGGMMSGGERNVVVGLGPPDAPYPTIKWAPPARGGAPIGAKLRVFVPFTALLAGAGFLLGFVGLLLIGRTTPLLRDGDSGTTYSLARVQLAFWGVAILFGFSFIWVLTGQVRGVIPAAAYALLGISGATAAVSAAVPSGSNTAGSSTTGSGATGSNPSPEQSSGSFFKDILWAEPNKPNSGPVMHRVQVALWTAVLGAVFLWTFFESLTLIDFDANLLILAGVVNGVYAGLKTRE